MFAPVDVALAINIASIFPSAGKLCPLAANETESRSLKARHWLRECQLFSPSRCGFGLVLIGMRLKLVLIRNASSDKRGGRGLV